MSVHAKFEIDISKTMGGNSFALHALNLFADFSLLASRPLGVRLNLHITGFLTYIVSTEATYRAVRKLPQKHIHRIPFIKCNLLFKMF